MASGRAADAAGLVPRSVALSLLQFLASATRDYALFLVFTSLGA